MTWATRSLSATANRTGLFLKKQLWIWPIVAVLVLSVVGYFVRSAIEQTIKGNVRGGLQTLVQVETEMLKKWFAVQESTAESLANNGQVRRHAYALLDEDLDDSYRSLKDTGKSAHESLAQELDASMSAHRFTGYIIADKQKQIVSSSHSFLIGESNIPEYDFFLDRSLNGDTCVSPPFPSAVRIRNSVGQVRMGVPTMYASAPIRNASFQVIGVIALQIRPESEFTEILQLGRVGESGETYAFNSKGVMVSNSRFDEELVLLGLLADREDSRSILQLMVRDPGTDMTAGFRPSVRRSKLPLTKMAASAISGESDIDVDGYRDYRGVPVIGSWTWLPKYEIGIAIEVDVAQAFRPLVILQRTFLVIYGLLIVSAIAIFVFTVVVARLKRQAREAVIEAQQLGQYTLENKLGEGGMGIVYKGHHSMLRRPTAIKLLHADKVNDTSIGRFEREVQITCQLNHANTIAIYDYGRTPEGVFYYAMEYLDGIDLQTLVDEYGPQSESRVIHILMQVCGSLFEAHSLGLVHRDIKPANIMLNRRGCQPDVIKVLDFGLVKAIDQEDGQSERSLTGTPLYMSPESIQTPLSVDARSDLYAVGAVGYFLLTGRPVFEANGIAELCQKHVDESPASFSQVGVTSVSPQLEDAIMSCLEKSRAKRPQTARDLAQLILSSPHANHWTSEDGDRWWGRHERGIDGDADATQKKNPRTVADVKPSTGTATLEHTIDLPDEEIGGS